MLLSSYYSVWFYRHRLVCHLLIATLSLSLTCYDVVLFVVLLTVLYLCGVIQTSKMNLINPIYQIMIVSLLNN